MVWGWDGRWVGGSEGMGVVMEGMEVVESC